MNKMTLIYVKGPLSVPPGYVAPGNILAGLSRIAMPTPSPPPGGSTPEEKRAAEIQSVGELIGSEMSVRGMLERIMTGGEHYLFTGITLKVPFDQFGLFTTDLDADVLKDPRRYYVDEAQKKTQALPPPAVAGASPTVALTTAAIKITLPSAALEDLGVWVLIQAVGSAVKTQVRFDLIKKDPTIAGPSLTLNGVLPSGPYSVLTLVTGYQPTLSSETA